MRDWAEIPERESGGDWVELDERPAAALWLWAAGPANSRRGSRQDDSGRLVRVETDIGGKRSTSFEPFTAADRASVEASITDYLGVVGLPDRPPGFSWYLRLPEGLEGDEFLEQLDRDVPEPSPVESELRGYLADVGTRLREFYSRMG